MSRLKSGSFVPSATPFIPLRSVSHQAESETAVTKERRIAAGKKSLVNIRETSTVTPSPRFTNRTGKAVPAPRAIRQISEVANTVRKPISPYQSQSVKKLASHGITVRTMKRAAMIHSTIRRKERGNGGRRAGVGRSNGKLMRKENATGSRRLPLFR